MSQFALLESGSLNWYQSYLENSQKKSVKEELNFAETVDSTKK